MNKFKKILLGALSVLTLGLFVATGAKVTAATAEEIASYGNYTPSDGLASQSWDFTSNMPGSSITLSAGNVLIGGIIFYQKGSSNSKLHQSGYLDAYTGVWYIPVMANSKGRITITPTGSYATDRIFALNNSNDSSKRIAMTSGGAYIDYSSSDITSYNNSSYLSFTVYKECKVGQISITSSVQKTLSSLESVVLNKSFGVGETITKNDLTVNALYAGDSDISITEDYTFKVYDSNNEEVTGAFTTAGDGYYVVATSTEDSTKSVTSSTFRVGEQTRFVYDFNTYQADEVFNVKDDKDKYVAIDTYKIDDVITLNQFKRYESSTTYSWTDGFTHNTNGLQGSTMTITLAKAAKVSIYAIQTNKGDNYASRCMYFADENDNTLMKDFCFTVKDGSITTNLKVCSINLEQGTYNTYSTEGVFNIFAVVIDYTDSSSMEADYTSLVLEHSTGTALSGTGTAARFVGKLENVNIDDIASITLDLTLTLSDSTKKNASITITSLYTGLPGYDAANGTLYFYYVITGLERNTYAGCSIKGTATVVMGSAKGFSSTTWTNA